MNERTEKMPSSIHKSILKCNSHTLLTENTNATTFVNFQFILTECPLRADTFGREMLTYPGHLIRSKVEISVVTEILC